MRYARNAVGTRFLRPLVDDSDRPKARRVVPWSRRLPYPVSPENSDDGHMDDPDSPVVIQVRRVVVVYVARSSISISNEPERRDNVPVVTSDENWKSWRVSAPVRMPDVLPFLFGQHTRLPAGEPSIRRSKRTSSRPWLRYLTTKDCQYYTSIGARGRSPCGVPCSPRRPYSGSNRC